MLTLHGSAISNYYNKVKLALLEKGVPFEEAYAKTHSSDEAILSISPLSKIPFITMDGGKGLCESTPILEWIEVTYPQPALMPSDPFAAAKIRELTTFIDWHLEIVVRQLYNSAFFGGAPLSEANAGRICKQLEANIAAFRRLAKFAPFVGGETLTHADLAAFNHFPLVAMATKIVYGEDLLQAGGVDHKAYTKFIGERPSAQKVVADRKAAQAKL